MCVMWQHLWESYRDWRQDWGPKPDASAPSRSVGDNVRGAAANVMGGGGNSHDDDTAMTSIDEDGTTSDMADAGCSNAGGHEPTTAKVCNDLFCIRFSIQKT